MKITLISTERLSKDESLLSYKIETGTQVKFFRIKVYDNETIHNLNSDDVR